MARYGMLIDLKSCNACRACMTACKGIHGIPFGEHDGREYYRIWPVEVELGEYPYAIRNMTPFLCMQCEDPPCMVVCPIPGAIHRREDGIVLVDEQKCDGCKVCIPACPYGALYFREDKRVVDKCTFCVENVDEGVRPQCVKTCPVDAIFFGDLDDPESQVSKLIKRWDARPLRSELGTRPSVYYTAHAARLRGIVESQEIGYAVQGASVTVKCLDGEGSTSAMTDSDGVFFFWNLKVRRRYSINIEASGFSPVTRELRLDEEYTDLGRIPVRRL